MSDTSFSPDPPPAAATPDAPAAGPPRRLGRWLALAGLALAAVVALAAWRYVTSRPDYRLRDGRRAIAAGDYDRAWQQAAALEAAGEADRAELLRGEALLARGEFALALDRFNRVRDDHALRVRAALHAGRCLVELRQLGEAFRVLAWALTEAPDDADGHRAMGALAYDLGQMSRARHHLHEVARLDPGDGRPYRLLGLIYKFTSDYHSARENYAKALARELSVHFRREVWLEMAEMAHEEKKPAEVLQALDELAALGGEAPAQAASLRAGALLRQGKAADARPIVARALARHPREADLWALRGEIELSVDRDAKKAVASLEKAAELAPGDYRTAYLLGQAYSGAGRTSDAKTTNDRAAKLKQANEAIDKKSREAMARPWDGDVRVEIAQLWEELHNPRMAAVWYRAAEACQYAK